MHPNWKHWERGWGYTLELAPGLAITVSKGHLMKAGFKYQGLGRTSRKEYETDAECKIAAEGMAERVLTFALKTLKP